MCQDKAWSKRHAAANDVKNYSHGIASLKRRSRSWTTAEKMVQHPRHPVRAARHGSWRYLWHIANKSELLDRRLRRHRRPRDERALGRRDARGNHSRPRAGHVRRDRRASMGWLGAHTCPWPVADGAHSRTYRPAGSRSRRSGRRTVGNGGGVTNHILGVAGQNAANGQLARARGVERSDFLDAVATAWSQLDPDEYPFTRSVAGQVRAHDDRVDFLAGINLILSGIGSPRTSLTPSTCTA